MRRVLVLAALVYLLLFAWTGHLVGRAEEAYHEGRLDEAHAELARAAFWRARRGRVHDALGVVDLARGRADEARSHLAVARRGFFRPASFGEERILLSFLRAGRLEPARAYAAHRLLIDRSPANSFYLAAAENGLNLLEEAEEHLAPALADPALRERAERQRAIIADKRRRKRSDYLLDRQGSPLAAVDLKSGRPAWLVPDLAPLLSPPHGPAIDPRDGADRVRLTLDLGVQRAAEAALGPQRGALVVLDVRTGGLLAAASQSGGRRGRSAAAPLALEAWFEPGSIIKMITLSAALRRGIDVEGLFPMDCPGWILIDGLAFRDWMTHRRLASIDEAVAVSCNIAFARLGQMVGRDALDAELRRYGFDAAPEPGGDLAFGLGRLLPEDTAHPDYALARRAVGLDSISITPIHAAMLAAALARAGIVPAPHLVHERINILGEARAAREPEPAGGSGALPDRASALILRTMTAAVTAANGTARRAAVAGLAAAMKTGTSGRNPPGYDAVVVGFAPAPSPTIAWALVAERAGKAELEGARITRAFLEKLQRTAAMSGAP